MKERIHQYCLGLKGTTHDYKPEWSADRYHIGGKMYAMMGGDAEGTPIVSLKCDPERTEILRDTYEGIFPGYYMNKTHWNSIYLDANLPDGLLEELISHSYTLVFNKLTKKMQKQVLETEPV
ncbi:MmcQ/YjbR family DNA-binding protein [Bacillus marinisedimentorum]|uniref:MmcQ/YjbR family DNA-binding protein n=1 Tax=Bacillus marinisedimentorum TaxID=1821260 RepID=UPI00087273CD|nr:MmcQ/YjbR family DNA-binding protein [Bacillus marinisedimentorum]